MGHAMPATTQCSRCSRTLPVRSCVQVGDTYLPMFVVLMDVGTVEEALAQATCQMCLSNKGSPERDLYKILLGLGCESAAPTLPTLGGIPSRRGRPTAPSLSGVSIVEGWNRDPTRPSLAGVTIERPRRPVQDWRPPASEPRLPRVLLEEPRREPERPIEHLTGAIGESGDNAAVLEVAMKAARERDEAKRRVRVARFGGFMGSLTRLLARIRETAALADVQDEVAQFLAKLSVAAGFDPKSRGKKRLTEYLGTSQGELERLCYFFYGPRERRHIPNPEIISVDAFEGGRRPEFWDQNGGMRPDFYVVQVEIVRTKSTLPVPNIPLSGSGEDPRPRIVYPEGGQFGSDYAVEHSRREEPLVRPFDWELKPFGWALISLASWLGDHPDLEIMGLNLSDLVCWFIEPSIMEEEDEPATATNDSVATMAIEPTTATPDLPATT